MTSHPASSLLTDLLGAWCDGLLTDADQLRLEQMLRHSASALDTAVMYLDQHAALSAINRRSTGQASAATFIPAPALKPKPSGLRRSAGFAAAIAALIALALTAWFGRPSSAPQDKPRSETHVAQRSDASQSTGGNPQSGSVATLTNVENAVFTNEAPRLGTPLSPGMMTLKSGTAQIMFASTAVVDLTGPCDFRITGPNRGQLSTGSLQAYVPERAHGFIVDLPGGGRIVDLGTAFRIDVDPHDHTRLRVTQGMVAWIRSPGAEPVVVRAGGNAQLIGGQIVRTDGLVGHWTFDNRDLAETSGYDPAGAHDGQPVGSPRFSRDTPPGLTGYALDLTGGDSGVKIAGTDLNEPGYLPTFDGELTRAMTIAVWVKGLPVSETTPEYWQPIVAKTDDSRSAGGFALRRYASKVQATASFGNGAGANRYSELNTRHVVVYDGRWHHLTITWSAGENRLRLYVDGELVNEHTDIDRNPIAQPNVPLSIGYYAASTPRFAHVLIDDLRIYNNELSPQRVRSLSALTPTEHLDNSHARNPKREITK